MKKIVTATVLGIAAGAIMGILLAPEKGSKTRKKLLKKKEEYSDLLEEKFDELLTELCEKYGVTKEEAESLIEKGKKNYNENKKEVTDVKENKAH